MAGTDISHLTELYRNPVQCNFPEVLDVRLRREWPLKYGENPHQSGGLYVLDSINRVNAGRIAELTDLVSVRSDGKGKGGLSATNTMDVTRAMDALKYFAHVPACVIMKHTIVSGFAKDDGSGKSNANLFLTARDCDVRSNYGGTAVFTRPVDMATAEALFSGLFVDVLAAPGYEEGVVGFIQRKSSNMRLAQFSHLDVLPKFRGDDPQGLLSIKEMPTGRFVVQDIYLTAVRSVEDLIVNPQLTDANGVHRVNCKPATRGMVDDCLSAWYINIAGARSNGVVAVRDGVLVSCGSGQVERVGAVSQMIVKGMQKAMDREGIKYDELHGMQGCENLRDNPFRKASVSSDGFIPFKDSIGLLGRVCVGAIIQPFGSKRDPEVIDELNEQEMCGLCTGERGFGHF